MRQNPRQLALAQAVSHRIAVLHESDAEICAATGLDLPTLQKITRSKIFKEIHTKTLDKLTDKVAEKALAIQCGTLEQMVRIRRENAWAAYMRIVEIAQTAESEKIRFDANKWLAAAGGISEIQESLPTVKTERLEMDDKTKAFVVATIQETEKIKSRSLQMELPDRGDADVIDIAN